MPAYLLLLSAIIIQLIAAFLAFRLVLITKRKTAWIFIATAILLMVIRRCFTLYEWSIREMSLMPLDISSELVGLATTVLMLLGVAYIAPLFKELLRSQESLREMVEERTTELKNSYQALQLELSQREKAEESLRESEERFRTFADFTYDWESWIAPDGTYNYISPSCQRITGYQADEFMKDPELLGKIIHPDDRGIVVNHLREDISRTDVRSVFFRIITRAGQERWIAHVCQPVQAADGRNLGRRASNRDITRYKKAEEEKAQLEVQLRQAQKMEAIGTLAGGIAHDFNNILSPIIMYTEIALRDVGADNAIRPYLEQVLKSSKRAADLVKQILLISRKKEQQKVMMQLEPIIKESVKLLRASLPATVEIRQEIISGWDWILADPTEIYQIVMNLCTNAAHAMEGTSGILTVSLDHLDLEQEKVTQGITLKPGSYLRLTVQDTGQGMPPEVMERIFEPYFTTKGIGRGTGLGLALVHGIVKNCGGGIDVMSEPGKGTAFQLFFPMVKNAEALEPETVAPLPKGKERIMMVDDEPDIVTAAEIFLTQLGYEVAPFTNSLEALKSFEASPDKFDLVITDLTMPGLTGVELAKEILPLRPQIPIIICTGYGESITLEKAKALGIRELILKPIIPSDLAESIRLILDTNREA
jgi:PAS domain S-box-containing protein